MHGMTRDQRSAMQAALTVLDGIYTSDHAPIAAAELLREELRKDTANKMAAAEHARMFQPSHWCAIEPPKGSDHA